MGRIICFISSEGLTILCSKEICGMNTINCEGCSFKLEHDKYITVINAT